MLRESWKSFKRSWIHHTGVQLTTLLVLTATFSIVTFFLSVSLNLQNILTYWGETVQITVYLKENVSETMAKEIQGKLAKLGDFNNNAFVSRENATAHFKSQMANYAPDLLQDSEFNNPFPASIQLGSKGGVKTDADVKKLNVLAEKIHEIEGVEDVSYGQSWIKNYSSFVQTLSRSGWALIVVLMAGSLLVIGNSVKSSIMARREEIEILELVGATRAMIRTPYITEGAFLGAVSAILGLVINLALYSWGKSALQESLALARLTERFAYFNPLMILLIVFVGSCLGAIGAYVTVRNVNDGWAASQGVPL